MILTDEERVIIQRLVKRGLVPYTVIFYNDINERVNALIQSGMKKTRAVIKVSGEIGVSEVTVWKALKLFKG